jgi:hypothetical protein
MAVRISKGKSGAGKAAKPATGSAFFSFIKLDPSKN